jgi:hypothetical protein
VVDAGRAVAVGFVEFYQECISHQQEEWRKIDPYPAAAPDLDPILQHLPALQIAPGFLRRWKLGHVEMGSYRTAESGLRTTRFESF